jgi:uncharacterized protein YoxC
MAKSIEELSAYIDGLQRRHESVIKKKAELGGELKAKKEELGVLIREITTAGYSPKTLVEDRNKAQADLEALAAEFEKGLVEAEQSIQSYDKR